MANHRATITGWHGYKIDATSAEVVVTGHGFGDTQGVLRLNVQGLGKVDVQIVSWSDTSIIGQVDPDVLVQRGHVFAIDERGMPKQADQTPAGETRGTGDNTPTWTVTSTDDLLDHIVVTGTGLDAVGHVFLLDSSIPERMHLVPFVLNGSDLEIEWPASFDGPIQLIRLVSADGTMVEEISGGEAGFTPQNNGVIDNITPLVVGGGVVLNIMGMDLDSREGTVDLGKVGEPMMPAHIVSNSWTDSFVQVSADPGSSYDRVDLTRIDGEIAGIAPSVTFPIVTPSLAEFEITSIEQLKFAETDGVIELKINGSRLDDISQLYFFFLRGRASIFNPSHWPDSRNEGYGISQPPVFSSSSIQFTVDATTGSWTVSRWQYQNIFFVDARGVNGTRIGFLSVRPFFRIT